jgi:hypothetical protein
MWLLLRLFTGDKSRRLGKHHVLRSGCAFVLGLDLLCCSYCGQFNQPLLIHDTSSINRICQVRHPAIYYSTERINTDNPGDRTHLATSQR